MVLFLQRLGRGEVLEYLGEKAESGFLRRAVGTLLWGYNIGQNDEREGSWTMRAANVFDF